jgi:serine/threonine-protein kinase
MKNPLPSSRLRMSGFLSSVVSLLKIVCVLALCGALFVISGYLSVQWALSADEIDVPDVVGRPLEEARGLLSEHGLIVEVEEHPLTDDEIPEGYVVRQNPLAGTAIKRQRGIRLTLSSGAPDRALPMTVGDSLQRSQIALEQKNVGVEYVARVYSWEFARDGVIAQQPNTTELPEGADVQARLLVSLGPPPRTWVMPDLVYRNVAEVRPFLERLGLRVNVQPSGRRYEDQPPGTILSHQPDIGFKIKQGDPVVLVINP